VRVLVAGIARSGTTWVGEAMSHAPDTAYVHEPDNRGVDPFAGVAKRGLGVHGFYPVITADDDTARYALLWDLAFRGGWPPRRGLEWTRQRVAGWRSPRLHVAASTALARIAARAPQRAAHVVVKSVHSVLALDWVARHTGATVVIVRRPPLEIAGSWLKLGMPAYPLDSVPEVRRRWLDPLGLPPQPEGPELARVAWTVACLDAIVEHTLAEHPEWVVVDHPDLCVEPRARFRELFDRVGLPWSDAVERFLAESDQPGSGFAARRVAAEQRDRWRRSMGAADLATVESVLEAFPARAAPTIAARDAARPTGAD
jgi:hypothetical protein